MALKMILTFTMLLGLSRAPAHWTAHRMPVLGPYTDLVGDPTGYVWITSRSVQSIVRMSAGGQTTVFRTPGYVPAYLTYGQDTRIWMTFQNHPNDVGAIDENGQLTVYVQQQGVGDIPASKITSLTNYGTMLLGARYGIIGFGGEGGNGYERPYLFAPGKNGNDQIAMVLGFGLVGWFTECCLSGGGAVGTESTYVGLQETALPYPECRRPAGIVELTQLSRIYIPCAGSKDTILVSLDETTMKMHAIPFPGRYPARVNTVAQGMSERLYFSTGAIRGLVVYDAQKRAFSTIAAPNDFIPRSIVSVFVDDFYVLPDDGRPTIYEYQS
jgi:hypothetical protein